MPADAVGLVIAAGRSGGTPVVSRGFSQGRLLPPGVAEETISHLLRHGMIEEVRDG